MRGVVAIDVASRLAVRAATDYRIRTARTAERHNGGMDGPPEAMCVPKARLRGEKSLAFGPAE